MAQRGCAIIVRNGSLTYAPDPIPANPGDQIIWTLTPQNNWTFLTNGIVCDTNPPTSVGYTPWTTAQPTAGPGPNQFTVTTPPTTGKYKYSINLQNDSGQTISVDPDIANDPGTGPGAKGGKPTTS